MSSDRRPARFRLGVAALAAAFASAAISETEAPWKERYELVLPPPIGLAPTNPERLAAAEVLLVRSDDLTEDPQSGQWELDVHAWDRLNGGVVFDPDNFRTWPFCHMLDPFYGQPTPGGGACSAVLVGPDLVLTAGHCVAGIPEESQPPYDCSHRAVVLDYAVRSSEDPLGDEWPGGPLILSPGQVVGCDEVLVDTHINPGTDPDDALLEGSKGADWALLRLTESVDNRLPVPIERFAQTEVGDPVLVLGHPARIPTKGEFSQIVEGTTETRLHGLGGTSGSPIFNLATGRVGAIVTQTDEIPWVDIDFEEQCVDLCFECDAAFAVGTAALLAAGDVDPIGLQLSPGTTAVDYYGPPTSAAEYEPWTATVSVPAGSLPLFLLGVDWAVQQEDAGPQYFEVVSGASSGVLGDGESVELGILPADWLVSTQGVYSKTMPFLDYTYGTRDPVTHRVFVGVEGFSLFPSDPFDGEGPGAEHGDSRIYQPTNRWAVSQLLTIQADQPWVRLNGQVGTTPLSVTLPPAGAMGSKPKIEVLLDGAGLLPGVRTAQVTFSSDDSGSPAFERVADIRFDHCRQKNIHKGVPLPFDIAPGEIDDTTLSVLSAPDPMEDVDVAVRFEGWDPHFEHKIKLSLVDPGGLTVVLKDFSHSFQEIYDDDTAPAPGGDLTLFEGRSSSGVWTLLVESDISATQNFQADLARLEIRLHHEDAPACVP